MAVIVRNSRNKLTYADGQWHVTIANLTLSTTSPDTAATWWMTSADGREAHERAVADVSKVWAEAL